MEVEADVREEGKENISAALSSKSPRVQESKEPTARGKNKTKNTKSAAASFAFLPICFCFTFPTRGTAPLRVHDRKGRTCVTGAVAGEEK